MFSLTDALPVGAFAEHCPAWPRFIDRHDRRHLAAPLKKQSSRAVLHRQHRPMGVKSSMSGNIAMCSRRFLLNIKKPPAQGRGFFRRVGLHPPSRNGNLSCHVTRCGNECPLHPRTQHRRRIISAASSGVDAMSTGRCVCEVRGHHEAARGGCGDTFRTLR
jgi:hypothetical protein